MLRDLPKDGDLKFALMLEWRLNPVQSDHESDERSTPLPGLHSAHYGFQQVEGYD